MVFFKRIKESAFFAWLILFLFLWGSCGTSRKVKLDPESRSFYETARLIMTKQEKKIFNHLPDKASRDEFIREFWQKRDPDSYTEINEFKDEFYRRVEYANDRFMEGPPGWKTDRGRIYIFFGDPDKIEHNPFVNLQDVRGTLLWVYYRYDFAVYFIDRGDGRYNLEPVPAGLGGGIYGDFFGALEMAKLGYAPQTGDEAKKFMDFELEYDKRSKEMVVSLPVEGISFREEEGKLKVDFEFEFFIYKEEGARKEKTQRTKSFETTEQNLLQMKELVFSFSIDLEPGKHIIDVIIRGDEGTGKTRKIFEIKV